MARATARPTNFSTSHWCAAATGHTKYLANKNFETLIFVQMYLWTGVSDGHAGRRTGALSSGAGGGPEPNGADSRAEHR